MSISKIQYDGIVAAVVNPTDDAGAEFLEKAFLLWDKTGAIEYFSAEPPALDRLNGRNMLVREHAIAMPGLIDLHTHLPQYEFAAQGADALLPWLERYTYPQEARFADETVAIAQSENFFRHALAAGTTTVVAYLAPHAPAAKIAFESAAASGLRAYLGPSLMDRAVPESLVTATRTAEELLQSLAAAYHKRNRCELVVTPRFALSCSPEMLKMCGDFSRKNNLFLQTHISENTDEVAAALKMFPQSESYAEIYDKHGCLHQKTLLGHGVHLTPDELALIRERQSVVVHCPTSNAFLGSGIMPWRKYHENHMRTGLGTDVAAGTSLSMLAEARAMTEVAKLRAHFMKENAKVNVTSALWQATRGNALALGRSDLGRFAVGNCADLIVLDDKLAETVTHGARNNYDTLPERLQRVIYRTHPNMVSMALVDGGVVFARGA
ncbi:MAG: amidohydrolase family protein [Spirochaetes bacterium]|nr:amidohydrolase family protein [Spirochaetota bacterium]